MLASNQEPRNRTESFMPQSISIDCDGIAVSALVQRGGNDTLVVLFHGAMNREKRVIPFHMPFLSAMPDVWQISIADPVLEKFDHLPAGWYLGWSGHRLWDQLSAAIRRFASERGCARRIYVGGSSGGFATLLYAALDPGSTAIAYNPQTDLENHVYPKAAARYFNSAWNGRTDGLPLRLADRYQDLTSNRIVLLQSSGDIPHLRKQAMPFLSALPDPLWSRVVVDFSFEGILGHGGSIRRETVDRWVLASIEARDDQDAAAAILETKHALDLALDSPGKSVPASPRASGFAQSDMRLADQIAARQLRKAGR